MKSHVQQRPGQAASNYGGLQAQEIFARQTSLLAETYQLLTRIMPERFFQTLGERIGDLLPLLQRLRTDSGIRRAEINGEIFRVYFLSDENNPRRTCGDWGQWKIAAAAIYRASQPLEIDGVKRDLVIEHLVPGRKNPAGASVSLAELQAACRRDFPADCPEAIAELYARLHFDAVADLDAAELAGCVHAALQAQHSDCVWTEAVTDADGKVLLRLALAQPVVQRDLFPQLTEAVYLAGYEPAEIWFHELTSGGDSTDFGHLPVSVMQLTLHPVATIPAASIERLLANVRQIHAVPMDDLLHRELVQKHQFSIEDANFIRAAGEFVHGQLALVDRNAYNYDDIFRFLALYPALSGRLAELFHHRFDPADGTADDAAAWAECRAEIERINSGDPDKDHLVRGVFAAVLNFAESIVKTNFFVPDKSALAFRLDPAFMAFYPTLGTAYDAAFPGSDRPEGVFFFYRRQAIGYQLRFAEIARGGWRTVIPPRSPNELEMFDNYAAAKDELFREVFVLAHTQHLKNKDIYEGGAKMITLLEPLEAGVDFRPALWQAQRSIFRAFFSLINYAADGSLRTPGIIDRLGKREIIEIGPDENMFDAMIGWMGEYAAEHGYTLGSGIISGKPDTGINHKEFGMTSFGVHQYLLKVLEELHIDPEHDVFSIKLAGGPAGDVAGNELKLLLTRNADGAWRYPNLRIVAVTDGPAAAYDPEGLDREMLHSLLFRAALDQFEPEKLRGEGAMLLYSAPRTTSDRREVHELITRRHGKLEHTLVSRDEYMRLFQENLARAADVFIPAGGRPSTLNEENYRIFFPAGQPSCRAIVEGANSFLTPAAREAIQKEGVLIIKDASANKCGVITSSYEILAGLMLNPAEFRAVKPQLVGEVLEILRNRARREADWLFVRYHASGAPLTRLTDQLSREINAANVRISEFLRQHPEWVTDALVQSHLPPLFAGRFSDRIDRLPVEYRRAIAAVELACRMIYAQASDDLADTLKMLLTPPELTALPR